MRRRELIVVRRLSSHFPRPRLRASPSCWSGYYERRPTSVLIITRLRIFLQNHVSTNKILEKEEYKYRIPKNRLATFTQMQIFIITKKLEPQQKIADLYAFIGNFKVKNCIDYT